MQQFTPRLWSAAGMVAAAVAVAATVGAPANADAPYKAPEEMFPGDFDRALALMLMGEGGEAGIGMHRVWPTASVPALSTSQIEKAIPGNTLAIRHHYTIHFNPGGKISGYHLKYDEIAVKKCPAKEVLGDGFLLHEGKCNSRKELPWAGTWRVENNKLCMNIAWEDGGKLDNCYHMFFMLDSIALVEPDGRLFGKAHDLKKGYAPDES